MCGPTSGAAHGRDLTFRDRWVCVDVKAHYNLVQTTGGNQVYTYAGRTTYTSTTSTGTKTRTESNISLREVIKPDQIQVYVYRQGYSVPTADGLICVVSYDHHFANGRLQFENYDERCSWPPCTPTPRLQVRHRRGVGVGRGEAAALPDAPLHEYP